MILSGCNDSDDDDDDNDDDNINHLDQPRLEIKDLVCDYFSSGNQVCTPQLCIIVDQGGMLKEY